MNVDHDCATTSQRLPDNSAGKCSHGKRLNFLDRTEKSCTFSTLFRVDQNWRFLQMLKSNLWLVVYKKKGNLSEKVFAINYILYQFEFCKKYFCNFFIFNILPKKVSWKTFCTKHIFRSNIWYLIFGWQDFSAFDFSNIWKTFASWCRCRVYEKFYWFLCRLWQIQSYKAQQKH